MHGSTRAWRGSPIAVDTVKDTVMDTVIGRQARLATMMTVPMGSMRGSMRGSMTQGAAPVHCLRPADAPSQDGGQRGGGFARSPSRGSRHCHSVHSARKSGRGCRCRGPARCSAPPSLDEMTCCCPRIARIATTFAEVVLVWQAGSATSSVGEGVCTLKTGGPTSSAHLKIIGTRLNMAKNMPKIGRIWRFWAMTPPFRELVFTITPVEQRRNVALENRTVTLKDVSLEMKHTDGILPCI